MLLAPAALFVLAPLLPLPQQAAAELPAAIASQLDSIAHQIAKAGREHETKAFLALLEELGLPKAQLAKLQPACLAELAKVKRPADSLPDAAKRIKAVARQIAALIDKAPEAEKERLAHLVLRLDQTVDEAHKALGEEQVGDLWLSPDQKICRKRRGEILEAIEKAGRLEPPIESGPSDDELLVECNGGPGCFARYGDWLVLSCLNEVRTKRVLAEALRAEALSLWLRGNALSVPRKPVNTSGRRFYLLDQPRKYELAVDHAQKAQSIPEENVEAYRQLTGFYDKSGVYFRLGNFESGLESSLFCEISSAHRGPNTTSVLAGHWNWVSMALLGVPIPQYAWEESSSSSPRSKTHVDNPAERAQREEKLQLAKAGILGCRSWIAYLAEHGEDPRWEDSFVEELGQLSGVDLLKATTVAEFMQELGLLRDVLAKLYSGKKDEKPYAAMERALGGPVTAFEARWRAWIVPGSPGIAQALDTKAAQAGFPPDALAALARLNQIRKQAFTGVMKNLPELKLEREICEAAQKHAEYLVQNPEQADKWPDAHEEYRDKPGYTAEGHWSGNHSNVASKTEDPKLAVDLWVGTFYHRLPMLTPELVRVGWGQAGTISVLDVTSFVNPPENEWLLVYPADGMTNVPVHFQGLEQPNPVPEQPDEDFGYPITLQIGLSSRDEPAPEIALQLLDTGSEVSCWFSSPSKPTNPALVPKDAWCLIPKSPLKPNTSYTVNATWSGSSRKQTWSFKTGS